MAVGYNPSSIIGGPINSGSLDQLKAREELYRSKGNRSTQQLLYLNSKTGWVKLSSSVNVLNPDKADDETGTSTSAKNNVLFGGTFKDGSSDPKSGLNLRGVSSNTAYNKYESTGFRPMAGINTFKIDSKNRFGTLREAVVDFQVWSVEQLSEFESLYLRPGFTVLLEWGHSIYLKNNGTVQSTTPLTIPDYFTGSQTKEKIYEKIESLKASSNNNYDAVFGYIKNFVWSYRGDGGYDCKLTIISAGELIESVKVHLSANQSGDNPKDPEKDPEPNKTPLHNVLKTIMNNGYQVPTGSQNQKTEALKLGLNKIGTELKKNAPKVLDRYLEEIKNFRSPLNNINRPLIIPTQPLLSEKSETGEHVGRQMLFYIKMQDLLALINVTFLLVGKGKKEDKKLFSFNLDPKKSLFYTFPNHIALDPNVAVIPKISTDEKNVKLKYSISNNPAVEQAITEIKNENEDPISDQSILNIFLSVEYVLKILDSTLAQGRSNATVLNFVETLLSGMSRTMGGINSFGLHYEESEFKYYLVDRKLTPGKNHLAKSKINLTGLRATVTNISMTSKLSPNIASMIAISAQAGGTDVGEDTENMFRWNKGLVDRIVGKKNFIEIDFNDKKIQLLNSISQLQLAVEKFNNVRPSYVEDEFIALETTHYDVMQFLSRRFNNSKPEAGAPGIIPFDLDITLDGIGGIKIGQAFTINEGILPKKYDGVVGFIVTGISHTVQNNKWNTDLKAQTIIIGKGETEESYLEDLLSEEEIQDALEGATIEGDPSIPCKIIDKETIAGVPVGVIDSEMTPAQVVERLNKYPEVQEKFLNFFTEVQNTLHQYTVWINSTFRPLERSLDLYKLESSNGYPGRSSHNYGVAIDIQLILPDGIELEKQGTRFLWRRTGIDEIAKRNGISWAGDWDGDYQDDVHFYIESIKSPGAITRGIPYPYWTPKVAFDYLFTDKVGSFSDEKGFPAIKIITAAQQEFDRTARVFEQYDSLIPSQRGATYEDENPEAILGFESNVDNVDLNKYLLSEDVIYLFGPMSSPNSSYYLPFTPPDFIIRPQDAITEQILDEDGVPVQTAIQDRLTPQNFTRNQAGFDDVSREIPQEDIDDIIDSVLDN